MRGPGVELQILGDDPDHLVMEATYDGSSQMPPAHHHPSQTETFTVIDGRMLTIVDGEERVYETGETFDVAPGTTHQMVAEGPARLRWEVRPALRTAEFFERLYSGNVDENFLTEFNEEIQVDYSP
jgi:hypothetical protein